MLDHGDQILASDNSGTSAKLNRIFLSQLFGLPDCFAIFEILFIRDPL